MDLTPGARWKSAVCAGEVVVVRPPATTVVLECGGVPMVRGDSGEPAPSPSRDARSAGLQMGRRSWDELSGLEVLCVRAGAGDLAASGRPMTLRTAKKLPASD